MSYSPVVFSFFTTASCLRCGRSSLRQVGRQTRAEEPNTFFQSVVVWDFRGNVGFRNFFIPRGNKKVPLRPFHIECAASAAEIFWVKVETSRSLSVIAAV